MILRLALFICCSFVVIACNNNTITKLTIPIGFDKINDSCFVQFQNKTEQKSISNTETIVAQKLICNEFEIEIPFTEKVISEESIAINKISKTNLLCSVKDRLHLGDTIVFCIPWQGYFANNKLKSSIALALTQKIYVHYVIKSSTNISTQKSEQTQVAEVLAAQATSQTTIADTNKPKSNIPHYKEFVAVSGDEFEKEEFTLRYYLEYTRPEMLKHEFEPGYYLRISKTGSGDFAKRGDIVTIDYVGRFAMNGQKFDDSSLNPEPFEFELGKPDQILKGLEKAIYKLKVGGRAEVFFSSRFGYGAQGSTTGIVSKYKSLTFAVHLKKINKKQNELN